MYGRNVNRSLIIKRKFIRMKFSFVDMILRILVEFQFYILILQCTNKEVNLVDYNHFTVVNFKENSSKSNQSFHRLLTVYFSLEIQREL